MPRARANGANGGWCVNFRRAILAHRGSVGFQRASRIDRGFYPVEMLVLRPL